MLLDLLDGEEFIGESSKFVGVYIGKVDDGTINYISLNNIEPLSGEVIKFKGFLEIDPIDKKNNDIIPAVSESEKLTLDFISAIQKFKKSKGRYNEAS